LLTEALNNRETEGQGFTGSGQISSNEILIVVNRVETLRLHRKEVLDSTGRQLVHRHLCDLREACKGVVRNSVRLRLTLSFLSRQAIVLIIRTVSPLLIAILLRLAVFLVPPTMELLD